MKKWKRLFATGKIIYKYLPQLIEEIKDDWALGKSVMIEIRAIWKV